jgi:hypothetical protein
MQVRTPAVIFRSRINWGVGMARYSTSDDAPSSDRGSDAEDLATALPRVASEAMSITWHPASRLAVLQFQPGIELGAMEGALLVETLTSWIGAEGKRFGVLANMTGVRGSDSAYRVKIRDFFKRHRDSAYVAATHMGPVVRVVTEMFRLGTGVQLKGFAGEGEARAWLRSHGIAA